MTVERLLPRFPLADIYIVTASSQVELIKQQLQIFPSKYHY